MPQIGWKVISMPGLQENKPKMTYLEQEVPPSLNMRVPVSMTPSDLVMDDHKWSANKERTQVEPQDYVNWVNASQRIEQLIRDLSIWRCAHYR